MVGPFLLVIGYAIAIKYKNNSSNVTAIVQDRATRRSDPSATMAAYSMGRHPKMFRPLMIMPVPLIR